MAIYELEQRVLFDGAVAVQAAEVVVAEMQTPDACSADSSNADSPTQNPDSSSSSLTFDTPSTDSDQTQMFIDNIIGTYDQTINGEDILVTPDNIELLSLDPEIFNLQSSHEVAFINSSVMDSQKIVDSFGDNVEIVYLESKKDGVEQITQYLSTHNDISAVHIISHGNDGYMTLNGEVIDSNYIDSHSAQFAQWHNSLTPDADILIYGCDIAKGEVGQSFILKFAAVTNADVAASTDGTGGHDGNWILEYCTGVIEANAISVHGYEHNLTNYLVTNTSGSAFVENSFPWAVVQANLNPGADEINFDHSIDNTSITTNALIEITDDITITGNGTNKTIIQAAETELTADHRVLFISSGTVTISDLTIQNGYSETFAGGGVVNLGNLTLSNTIISHNASPVGGGIYNAGDLQLDNSTINNNEAIFNGGGIYNNGGTITGLSEVTISNNIADIYGGGIYSTGTSDISGLSILSNMAMAGGGVYSEGSLTASDLSISNNIVSDSGGGIYNKSVLTLSVSTIQNNIAGENGGGILNSYYASLILTGSTVTVNTANYGGGVYTDGTLTVTSSDITNNTGLIYANDLINGEDIPLVYLPVTSPDDPLYNELWGMKQILAPSVWSKYTGSNSITVAVIDTGVDYLHPDLIDNMWHNPGEIPDNGIDDDHNGYIDDYWGWNFVNDTKDSMDDVDHGTHCAGTIGAVGNNGIGVAGVNWDISIMAVKVFDNNGSAELEGFVNAIYYAVNMGAKILSCSWGGGEYAEELINAFEYANSKGVLAIIAAGNESNNNDTNPTYPANYDVSNIISIAATGNYQSLDYLASFSNYGAITVDFAAPGVNILSTVPDAVVGKDYDYKDGTSMATPMVSGAAALLWSKFPELTNLQIKDVLMQGVDKVDDLSGKCVTEGRLNLATSYQLAYNLFWRQFGTGFNDGTQTTIISGEVANINCHMSDEIAKLIVDSDMRYKTLFNIQKHELHQLVQDQILSDKFVTVAEVKAHAYVQDASITVFHTPITEEIEDTVPLSNEPQKHTDHSDSPDNNPEHNNDSISNFKEDPAVTFNQSYDYMSMINGITDINDLYRNSLEKHKLFKTITDLYLDVIIAS